jgi:hypothetical protein
MKKLIAGMAFVGIVGAGVASTSPASACGGGLWEPPNPEETTVDQAEQLLEDGKEEAAGEILSQRFWFIRGALPHQGTAYVFQRAIRTLAMASARHDGGVRVGEPYSHLAKKDNVSWAISRLRMLEKAFPEANTSSDLAEALSRNEATKEEGKQKLEALFAENRLVGRQAMNQLTKIRLESGDVAGAKVVAAKCNQVFGSGCEIGSGTVAMVK